MSIDAKEKTMPAGQFKQMCLGVLDSKVHERAVLKRLRGQGKMLVAEAVFLEPIHQPQIDLL